VIQVCCSHWQCMQAVTKWRLELTASSS
jgi:hypothetical protein